MRIRGPCCPRLSEIPKSRDPEIPPSPWALVALAHFIVTLTRRDVKDDVPDFTLDMAVRVLQSAFARDHCTGDDAFSIIEYHLRRNRAAHQSHRKSWLRKHKRTKAKPLL